MKQDLEQVRRMAEEAERGGQMERGTPIVESIFDGERVQGTIDVLDVRFSLWTNIPRSRFEELGVDYGQRVEVTIQDDTNTVYRNFLTYAHSFSDVFVGEPLVYANSLDCMAVAISQGSFAKAYGIGTGTSWKIALRKAPRLVYEWARRPLGSRGCGARATSAVGDDAQADTSSELTGR